MNQKLRKLKDKAETPRSYKHMSYKEMINILLPKLKTTEFTPNGNIIRFIKEIKKITTNTNINTEILKKIIKKKISNQDFNKLEIQVLIHVDHTIEDIIKFFIKNYVSPRELEENLMKFHQKTGTLKFCFKNNDHRKLDMEKSITVIQLVELHMAGLKSVIMAKALYEEYIGNSDLAFQNNPLN